MELNEDQVDDICILLDKLLAINKFLHGFSTTCGKYIEIGYFFPISADEPTNPNIDSISSRSLQEAIADDPSIGESILIDLSRLNEDQYFSEILAQIPSEDEDEFETPLNPEALIAIIDAELLREVAGQDNKMEDE